MGGRKLPHTGVYRGKRVLITLHGGEKITGHFHDRTKTHVYLREGQKIHKSLIRAFSIYKSQDPL